MLPDPELLYDAILLAQWGSWSPADLDGTDELLLDIVRRLKAPKKSR